MAPCDPRCRGEFSAYILLVHSSSHSHPRIKRSSLTPRTSQGSRLVLNLRIKHANLVSGPSSLVDLTFEMPSHGYSAVNLDDSWELVSEDKAGLFEDGISRPERRAGNDRLGVRAGRF